MIVVKIRKSLERTSPPCLNLSKALGFVWRTLISSSMKMKSLGKKVEALQQITSFGI